MARFNAGSNANLAAILARDGVDTAALWQEDASSSPLALWPGLEGVAEGLQDFAEGRTIKDPDEAAGFYPLSSGSLDWREWLRRTDSSIRIDLMSLEHIKLWRWIESLRFGVRPDAFFADWPRGYGKTTTGRLSMSRLCARGVRRFGLYVCGTLASANASIVSIRSELERQGVRRRESLYGHSLGWSSERIVTENGFTLIALGLDVANIRGLNLDKLRPDFIILDDIDGLTDSPEVSDKKLEILSSTVIPAGSRDCAFLITQNEIHGHGVVHRIITGDAGILRRRIVSKTVAVQGLEIVAVPRGSRMDETTGEIVKSAVDAGQWSITDAPGEWPELDGLEAQESEEVPEGITYEDELQIVSGRSTWPGKSLREWEDELNSMGELAFRREMQHELGAGGLFFNFWATRQLLDAEGNLTPSLPWHECDMPRILPHWLIQAGGDYGTASHHAQVIGALDEYGVLYIIGEEGEPNRTDKQQALALLIRLEELGLATGITPSGVHPGIGKRDKGVAGTIVSLDRDGYEVPQHHRLSAFALDPAGTMPPEGNSAQTAQERMSEYPVEVFRRLGIPVVRAQKNIVAGLGGLRDAMFRTVTYPLSHPTEPGRQVPMLRIVRGQAPMTQRYLETAVRDPKDEMRAVSAAKLEHCLTADTLVTTRRGDVPICDVTYSDEVLTRKGWRKVARAWLTAKEAEVYKVVFSDGRSITGTSGHPIYIHGRGFVTIDAIRYGDGIIDVCQIVQMSSEKPSNWTVSPIVGIQTRLSSRIKATTAALLKTLSRVYPATITETSGLRLTALSLMGGISTTKTATPAITRSAIWSACPQPSTEGFTLLRPILRSGRICKLDSQKCRSWLKRGTQAPPVKNGTASTRLNLVLVNGSLPERSVSSAALSFWTNLSTVASSALTTVNQLTAEQTVKTSWRSRARSVAQSLVTIATLKRCAAPRNARGPYVASVEPAGKTDVYNLAVEGEPEFFANGVLVHNCGDALRYLRMRAIEAVDPNAPKAVVLKDGTVLPPDTAQWFKDAMQPYAQQPPTNIGVSRYRGTAGRGR